MIPDKEKNKDLESQLNKPSIHTETLMHIFDFNEMAINTNRQGYPTQKQRQNVQNELKEAADGMWLLLTIFLGAAVVVGLILTLQGISMLPLVIGAGLLFGTFLLFSYRRQTDTRLDAETMKVRQIEGRAVLHWDARNPRPRLQVDNMTFTLTPEQAAALSEYALSPMRIYFAQNSKQILSAEIIDYWDEKPKVDRLKAKNDDPDDDVLLESFRDYDQREQDKNRDG